MSGDWIMSREKVLWALEQGEPPKIWDGVRHFWELEQAWVGNASGWHGVTKLLLPRTYETLNSFLEFLS